MTAEVEAALASHVHGRFPQEDLAFAYWHPSVGATRYTALINAVVWPRARERILRGNVAFRASYLERVLTGVPPGCGVALLHGHLGPGWQDMSPDDVVAERDRLAGAVAGRTGLPLVGMTRGTDGAWSARFWARGGPRRYDRLDARTVRVAGRQLRVTFHPEDRPPVPSEALGETATVWGRAAQDDLTRVRVAVVGLGNVGSLAAEAVSRMGLSRLTYIDHDRIELRNLDRTAGASLADVVAGLSKVAVAARATTISQTAASLDLRPVPASLLSRLGYEAALDCDVILCCVDRPLPRHVLNAMAYAHLVPVIDGGIYARVKPHGTPLHVDWRIQTVGPDHGCLVCGGALRRSDVALDLEGMLDDPDYIAGLSEAERAALSRRNVFPFGMSVAAHQVLQMVGLVTGFSRIGGTGPQMYHAYPGVMTIDQVACDEDCGYRLLASSGADLLAGMDPR